LLAYLYIHHLIFFAYDMQMHLKLMMNTFENW